MAGNIMPRVVAVIHARVNLGRTPFGVWLGNRFGHIFENKFEMLGGLILIGIAAKILFSLVLRQ